MRSFKKNPSKGVAVHGPILIWNYEIMLGNSQDLEYIHIFLSTLKVARVDCMHELGTIVQL